MSMGGGSGWGLRPCAVCGADVGPGEACEDCAAEEPLRRALLALETAVKAFEADRPLLGIARLCVAREELRRVVAHPVVVPEDGLL